MPKTVAATVPRRCGMLSSPNFVMDPIWEIQLRGPAID
jgi:hypothetical protein